MPELPEVETVKESLKHLIIGCKIDNVEVYYKRIIKNMTDIDFINKLKNQTFLDILRRGKYLIFILSDVILISHLRMEGKYLLKNSNEIVEKHEHVNFIFTNNSSLRYHDTRKFGDMFLYDKINIDEVYKLNPLSKLGVEPLGENLTQEYLKEKFAKSRKAIKTILLDQTVVSGLGNIYVDEVCFMAKVHPETLACTLSITKIDLIIESIKIVLNKAITLGGTTIRSFTSSHNISGRFQNELLVHTKTMCPVCACSIKKIRVGGRGTYLCDACQIKI